MAKLTWFQKLNNRLRRNWNTQIDYSKCFTANAVGKRNTVDTTNLVYLSDSQYENIYRKLKKVLKRDSVSIEYLTETTWDEDKEQAYREEREYYGKITSYAEITVLTPKKRSKIFIDTRYV